MTKSLIIFSNSLLISLLLSLLSAVHAEATVPTKNTQEIKKATVTEAELDQMMAPIALYPDSLLAQILMASTYPSDLTAAIQWSQDNPKQEGDDAVKAVQTKSWDPSVMSLVAFPQVLTMMGEQPDWTKKLGETFLASSEDVMDSVQKLRTKAKEQGNLKSSDEQKVITEEKSKETIIIIEPAKPETVYVPVYNTTVVYGTWWWPHYTPWYYYPPYYVYNPVMPAVRFAVGVGITYALWSNCNWRHGHGSININVNKFNNINIDRNKLDGSRGNHDWKHKNNRDSKLANKNKTRPAKNNRMASEQRQNFRGRESQRDKARSTLNNRAISPSEGRKQIQGSAGNTLSSSLNKSPNHATGFSRNQSTNRYSNTRNNAFRGSNNASRSRQNINRGNHSHRSMSRSRGGGRGGRR